MQSANAVPTTFGLQIQVTMIDVVDAAWGPTGLNTYNIMLNEDVGRTWQLIT